MTQNDTLSLKDESALPGMQALNTEELEQVEGGFDWGDIIRGTLVPVILSML